MVQKTILKDVESQEKRVKMPHWVVDYLKQGVTRQMSKGVVAYEVIQMVDGRYSDSVTEIEDVVNNELDSYRAGLSGQIAKIKNSHLISPVDHFDDAENPNAESQVSLRFPDGMVEKIHETEGQRYIGQWITEYVREVYESAYSDRFHRIEVKKDILRKIKNNEECETNIGKAVFNYDNAGEYEGLQSVRDMVDSKEDVNEYVKNNYDLESDEAREIVNENEIKQSRKYRIPLISAVLYDSVSEAQIEAYVNSFFDVSEATLDNYVDEICDRRVKFPRWKWNGSRVETGNMMYCVDEETRLEKVDEAVVELQEVLLEAEKVHYGSVINYLKEVLEYVDSFRVKKFLHEIEEQKDEHRKMRIESESDNILKASKKSAQEN